MARRERHHPPAGESAFFARRPPLVAGLVVLLVTGLVYASVVGNQFVSFDDKFHLQQNPHLNPPDWHGLRELWTRTYFGMYVPLAYTFFAVEAKLSGQSLDSEQITFNPLVFHGSSLALHVICSGLVFWLLLRLTRCAGAAMLGGLLFSLHPLQVESVAWVSETRGLLSAVFSLLALHLYLAFIGLPDSDEPPRQPGQSPPAATRTARWRPYALATLCLLLALLSKPSAVVVPLLAGVLDLACARRDWRAVAWSLAPWLLLAGGFAVLTRATQPDEVFTFISPVWSRPLIAGDALAFYLGKLVWPEQLTMHYGRSPEVLLGGTALYWTWLVPAGLLAALWFVPRLRPYRPMAALWIAGLAPVLGLIPFGFQNYSTVADRYMYLALLGPAWAVAWWLAHAWSLSKAAMVAALLLPLALWSHLQIKTWRDSDALYDHALQVNPRSWLAHMNRGCLRRDEAQDLLDQRRPQEAAGKLTSAMTDFSQAIELHPRGLYPAAYMQRASVSWLRGQRNQAIADYAEAIRLFPNNSLAYFNRGLAFHELRDYDRAVADYTRAIELNPENSDAYNNRAVALLFSGQDQAALDDFTSFIKLRPRSRQGYSSRAAIYVKRKQYDQARADLNMVKTLGGTPDPALLKKIKTATERMKDEGRIKQPSSSVLRLPIHPSAFILHPSLHPFPCRSSTSTATPGLFPSTSTTTSASRPAAPRPAGNST